MKYLDALSSIAFFLLLCTVLAIALPIVIATGIIASTAAWVWRRVG